MIHRIIKHIIFAFLLSIGLLIICLIIRYLILGSKTTLQDISFWVGAIPIGIFTIGIFGDFFTRGDASYQLSRSISSQSSNQRGAQDILDGESSLKNGVTWIMAGVFLWFYSYFM